MNPTLFLDRDGTVNVDLISEYVSRPEQLKLIPGAGKAIVDAKSNGFKISIITNQAGIAKGFTDAKVIPQIHRRLEELIEEEGEIQHFFFDDAQVCPHHPKDKCLCRKPEPGMLKSSMLKLNSDPRMSFFVGDKLSDLQCALAMQIRPILVLTGHGKDTQKDLIKNYGADFFKENSIEVAQDLSEAVAKACDLLRKNAS